MVTGASPIAALAHKVVPLYSDLLLHDMGSLGDGVEQGAAGAREIKTAPLWGCVRVPRLLHDGRATNDRRRDPRPCRRGDRWRDRFAEPSTRRRANS